MTTDFYFPKKCGINPFWKIKWKIKSENKESVVKDLLVQKIAQKIAVGYRRLSLVSNRDGLLTTDDVRHELLRVAGLTVVTGDRLQLRLHFELVYRRDVEGRYVYLTNRTDDLVPDMEEEAYVTRFDAADLFPLFTDKSLLEGLSLDELTALNERCGIRRIAFADCRRMVDEVKREREALRCRSAEHFRERMAAIQSDWQGDMTGTIRAVADCMTDAVSNGAYEAISNDTQRLNDSFQQWIDNNYFATLNSSHLLHPKSVNKILPFLSDKHTGDDRVALLVVDGLAYWQYHLLHDYLTKQGFTPKADTTLAWLPTITMLSRQAIFRGSAPQNDYKQSPANERRLWQDYWTAHGIGGYAIQYLSDHDEFAINEGVRRLAYVTVEMDGKMHSCTDYRDLLLLTENWLSRITEKIATMRRMGFAVYLTTDHGSVMARGWKRISDVEKVFLYKDGSRGKRHLIYNNVEPKTAFLDAHKGEIELLNHDTWLAVRSTVCFEREGQQLITHGGSHFWEVVIPFVTIE